MAMSYLVAQRMRRETAPARSLAIPPLGSFCSGGRKIGSTKIKADQTASESRAALVLK